MNRRAAAPNAAGIGARLTSRLLVVLALLVTACLASAPAGTSSPLTASDGEPAFTPVTGAVFTDPSRGAESESALRFVNLLNALITNTPDYGDIRIATMRLNVTTVAQDLIAAHQRGVTVRIVLPTRYRSDAASILLKTELNRHRRPQDASYIAFCTRACLANKAYSEAHSKLYLFSASGTGQKIVVTSSSNITTSGYHTAYNDAFTVVGDSTLYAASVGYFDRLHNDLTPRRNPYQVSSTPQITMQFFPDFTTGKLRDAVSTIFSNIHCRAAGSAGDGEGHTVVDLIQPEWSPSRDYVIDRLVRLRAQGCRVKVITTRGGPNPLMLKKLRRSPLRVRYSDEFKGDRRTLYAHSKYILISGGFYKSRTTRTVITGSTNMTLTGTRSSDNQMLQVRDDARILAAYQANFNQIWNRSHDLRRTTKDLNAAQRRASRGDE